VQGSAKDASEILAGRANEEDRDELRLGFRELG
jgi:hypothetical protein